MPYTGVIEPTARAAAAATRNKKVGIIGTDATIRSGSFVRALHAIDPATETVGQGCALLVPLVENGYIDFENKVTRLVLEDYLRPIRESGADTLILGCTHFPLLAPIIGDMLGEGVTLIDSGRRHRRLYPGTAPADRPGESPYRRRRAAVLHLGAHRDLCPYR